VDVFLVDVFLLEEEVLEVVLVVLEVGVELVVVEVGVELVVLVLLEVDGSSHFSGS
jgi:hypothetical protein